MKCAHNENGAPGIRGTCQPWALKCFKQDRSLKDRIHLAKPLKANEKMVSVLEKMFSRNCVGKIVQQKLGWKKCSTEIALEKMFSRNCGGKLTNSW